MHMTGEGYVVRGEEEEEEMMNGLMIRDGLRIEMWESWISNSTFKIFVSLAP